MADFATWVEKNRGIWTRVYDEVIAPDFEKEWEKREEQHQKELKHREENQQLLFNHINEQILKNARVVEENERLETELHERAGSTGPTRLEDAGQNSSAVSEEQHRELVEKYNELNKKYQHLTQKLKYLERKNNAVMQKNRDMKDSVRAWQQYADRQKPHQRKIAGSAEEGPSRLTAVNQNDENPPQAPSSPKSLGDVQTPLLQAHRRLSSPAPGISLTHDKPTYHEALHEDGEHPSSASVTPRGPTATNNRKPEDVSRDGTSLDEGLDVGYQLHRDTTGVPSSSQTTVDEGADQSNRRSQAIGVEDGDDLPEVISERSLKRKRGQKSRVDIYTGRSSDGTPAKPHRVKDEPMSSPPSAMQTLQRTETIDLDDPAPNDFEPAHALHMITPLHPAATGSSRQQRSGSAPFSQAVKQETAQRLQISANVQALPENAAAEMRALSEPMGPHLNEQHVLQLLDPNIVMQTPEQSSNKRCKQAKSRRVEHDILAESGEAAPIADENDLRLPPSVARAHLNQRMRATRTPQTPSNRLRLTPPSSVIKQEQSSTPAYSTDRSEPLPSGAVRSRGSTSSVCSRQPEDIVPDGRPVWSMRASDKRSGAHKSNTSPCAEHSRLRKRPVKELKAQDFKPNPAYNQGYSYAFSEAVRKRGDRMCLPGCTNSQCCGSHFRRLAEALAPLRTSQEEDLLEEYLGDAYNTVMSTQISSDERAELILQARTKKMAKETGKHREAYERRRTPPGFWRVDFPTTQEHEEDRVRAKEQEIKIVQERWLEAQKKGGRWIFRDE